MSRLNSQNAMILNFLESGESLTPIEALEKISMLQIGSPNE